MRPRVPIVILGAAVIAVFAASAGMGRPEGRVDRIEFVCDGAVTFQVAIHGPAAIVTTPRGRYILKQRRSSMGVRFGSDNAALAVDEDRAVFITETEGPYDNCRKRRINAALRP